MSLINECAGTNILIKKGEKVVNMCKGMQELLAEECEEGLQMGRREGRREEKLNAIRNMIELGLTREQILQKYSEEEYEAAQQGSPELTINV